MSEKRRVAFIINELRNLNQREEFEDLEIMVNSKKNLKKIQVEVTYEVEDENK